MLNKKKMVYRLQGKSILTAFLLTLGMGMANAETNYRLNGITPSEQFGLSALEIAKTPKFTRPLSELQALNRNVTLAPKETQKTHYFSNSRESSDG